MKLPRLHDAQPWIVFSFKYTLDDFKGFQLISITVSFCELDVEPQDLVKFLRRRLFQGVIFKMAGLAPASEHARSFTVL